MTLSDIPGSPTSLPQVEGSAGGALQIWPLRGIPEVAEGADLAGHLVAALLGDGPGVCDGDVLVVSSKVVSKAMGLRAPAEHRVGLVLAESARVLAERATPAGLTRIVATHAGPVLAGAGIDGSNVGAHAAEVLLLPRDPDAAAGTLAEGVRRALADAGAPVPGRLGVLLTDTAGRPWRAGQADIAIGAAGLPVVDDLRGGHDADGRPLGVTVRAVADELAGAADLVKGKAERVPAALVRGWTWPHPVGGPHAVEGPRVTGGLSGAGGACGTGGADALVRRGGADWFALGHVEAVRAALGVSPGTHEALDIGVPAAGPEEVSIRLSRACALALADGLGTIPDRHPRAHLAGARPALAAARLDVVQYGVVAEAPDELTLGVLLGRLLPALASENIPAAFARIEAAGAGHGPRGVVVFTEPAG